MSTMENGRKEAEKQIGYLYPKVNFLKGMEGRSNGNCLVWTRTVKCPNPACGCQCHLFAPSGYQRKGKEVWVEPIIDRERRKI